MISPKYVIFSYYTYFIINNNIIQGIAILVIKTMKIDLLYNYIILAVIIRIISNHMMYKWKLHTTPFCDCGNDTSIRKQSLI